MWLALLESVRFDSIYTVTIIARYQIFIDVKKVQNSPGHPYKGTDCTWSNSTKSQGITRETNKVSFDRFICLAEFPKARNFISN